MFKRIIGITLVLAFVLTSVACAKKEEAQTQTGPATVRLSTFCDENRMTIVRELVAEFTAANPNILVEIEHTAQTAHWDKKLAETASNTLPDVWEFTPGFGAYWIERELLLDIASYVAEDPVINPEDFDKAMWNYYVRGEKVYGVPYDSNGVSLFYNKDLMDEAGLSYPTNTWTYYDLYDSMKKGQTAMAAKGKQVWGLSSPITMGWSGVGYFDMMGTPLVNANGEMGVNETQTVEGLSLWLQMMNEGCMPQPEPANPANVIQLGATTFRNGNAFYHLAGGTGTAFIDAGMNVDAAPAPLGPTGVRGAKLGSGWVISASTKIPDASYTFFSFLNNEDSMFRYINGGGVPPRLKLLERLDGIYRTAANNITDPGYTWLNAVQGSGQIWTLKDTLLQQMWIGMLTPLQVVQELIAEGNEILSVAKE